MTLFVGLGNPGLEYENTRHNIGFKVIDKLVDDFNARDISKISFQGKVYRSTFLLFLKPQTFMNLSGKSVQIVKHFYKVSLENMIIIHDDIDLPFGALRFKRGGGHAGHNGLKSIDENISKEYLRVRVGIGKPVQRAQVATYVLHDFTKEEKQNIELLITHVLDACKALAKETLTAVKSKYSLKSIEDLL
ncbi:MAG: aminoacyl-tRNA hydrolase [Epsilonproteobacteria bacterium]|nr:MAG: aminoacyl-tRNA hydrolase [Campylobacterota bacterium]